ncbi:MAG TPA: TatD family hydrolase [Candidatus Polarisedimenticolia bacterium]|nr:TatD family hydrolase [Candidatus Polarisedimenticolia bacterium]
MLADAHAHLAMAPFAGDLPETLRRAWDAGVREVLTCATSWDDLEAHALLARRHAGAGVRAAAGIHPHQASSWDGSSAARLARFVEEHPEVVAIGEVGLDFHYRFSPPDAQRRALREQVTVAREAGLPLVVHCREAREDVAGILAGERAGEVGGMLHCFSEDEPFARVCLELGFHVSFSGIVTFRNAEPIRQAARAVPLDRLLVETDAPYLAPEPVRGRRNEPARVADVARFLATLRGESFEELAAATASNFRRLFPARIQAP